MLCKNLIKIYHTILQIIKIVSTRVVSIFTQVTKEESNQLFQTYT